ncbi:MAG: sulfatase-like hydrolase/transferase [Burkholderiales bacterium]|nr:sulfatase-like hydrolase/transferase [Burkholderiales bacterium]
MTDRPSFVFIMADDLGYADLGCYGARADTTPWIDRMAAEGLRFTDGYSNSPVCSPTRFALMTGRYQYRYRGAHDEPIGGAARGRADLGLPPELPTLPSILRDAGYRTALAGKWHLGYPPHFHPLKSGYQEFFGPLGGGIDYFSHCDRAGVHDLYENADEVRRTGYVTDLITDAAVAFIGRRRADEPFLLSVHYTAPHWPWETREDEAESRRIGAAIHHVDGGSVAIYQKMLHHMDEGIGRILAALAARGIDGNTLVVFTSDNGGERYSDTWPLVGKKMDLLEGGIRVPYVVRWPAVVPARSVTRQVAITMDWVATFFDAAGVAPHPDHPLDGTSLLPVLRDPAAATPRELFWRMKHRGQRAVRSGEWKYYAQDGNEFLYDLSRDARERADLKRRFPEKFDGLRARYEAWEATMPGIAPDARVSLVYANADMASPTN